MVHGLRPGFPSGVLAAAVPKLTAANRGEVTKPWQPVVELLVASGCRIGRPPRYGRATLTATATPCGWLGLGSGREMAPFGPRPGCSTGWTKGGSGCSPSPAAAPTGPTRSDAGRGGRSGAPARLRLTPGLRARPARCRRTGRPVPDPLRPRYSRPAAHQRLVGRATRSSTTGCVSPSRRVDAGHRRRLRHIDRKSARATADVDQVPPNGTFTVKWVGGSHVAAAEIGVRASSIVNLLRRGAGGPNTLRRTVSMCSSASQADWSVLG